MIRNDIEAAVGTSNSTEEGGRLRPQDWTDNLSMTPRNEEEEEEEEEEYA